MKLMKAGVFRQLSKAALILGFTYTLNFSGVQAQQPLYLPADIPLDVSVIFEELHPEADYEDITKNIIDHLVNNHYSEINFNDEFSGKFSTASSRHWTATEFISRNPISMSLKPIAPAWMTFFWKATWNLVTWYSIATASA